MKATFATIAAQANVSVATVDRVINDRPGVKGRTREAVLVAANALGYFGPVSAVTPKIKMDFLLPAGSNSFMALLRTHLAAELNLHNTIDGRLHLVEGFSADALYEKLLGLRGRTDAVGLVAIDHPKVSDAIRALAEDGVKIATIVSDVPRTNTIGYVGIDNRAAGRLAGYLIGRFLPSGQPAEVILLIGSPDYRGHEEREMGIRSILSREFPHLMISSVSRINDDRDEAFRRVSSILRENVPAAIYNIGSGNQGVARALSEFGAEGKVVFVGHDLTNATRKMILNGTMDVAIDQNPRVEAREVINLLRSAVDGTPQIEYPPRLQVIFRENLP